MSTLNLRSILPDEVETPSDINQEDTTVEDAPLQPEKSNIQKIIDAGFGGMTSNMVSPGDADPIEIYEERGVKTKERREGLADKAGLELDLTSSESADAIPMSKQMISLFGREKEELEEAYKSGLSLMPDGTERGIRFVYDEDANPLFGETGVLISVQRDDGTYPPLSTAKFGVADYTQSLVPFIASELALDAGVVTASLASAAAVSKVGLPGKIAAPFVMAYTLYAGGVQAEKFRNEISEAFGLKEEETETFFETLGELAQSTIQPLPFLGEDLTKEEILSGRIEAIFGALPVGKKAITYVSRQLSRQLHDRLAKPSLDVSTELFKSADEASTFLEKYKLGKLLPTQVGANKILQRFASLAEQTTNVIPFKFRSQNRKFINFLENLRDKGISDADDKFMPALGGGDLELFQEGFATFKKSVDDLDFGELGDAQAEMVLLFNGLRSLQSRLMYRNVTEAVGSRALDLTNVKDFIKTTKKTIVPVTNKESKIIGEKSTVEWANSQIEIMEEQLLKLGKNNQLNRQQVSAAKQNYVKNNQNNIETIRTVKTPAEMIFEYTQQLSNLSTRIRKDFNANNPMPIPVQNQLDYIRGLRNSLIDSYRTPILRKNEDGEVLYKEINGKLESANAFYGETKVITRNQLLKSTAEADELGLETTPIVTQTIGTKLGAPPAVVPIKTLETLAPIEEYIRTTLKNLQSKDAKFVAGDVEITDFGPFEEKVLDLKVPKSKLLDKKGQTLEQEEYLGISQLRKAFATQLAHKLRNLAATNVVEASGNPRAISDYLGSYSGREKELLGLSEVNEKLLIKEAIALGKIQSRLPGELMLKEKTTPFSAAVVDLFNDPSNLESNAKSMLDIVYKSDGIGTMKKGKPGPQLLNLRQGIFDHIFSETSGVIKKVTKNSAYGEVNDKTVEPELLVNIINQIETTPSLKKIMGEENLTMLKGIGNYAQVIQSTGTDAGSALSGAQLIANLYTLDPAKFLFTVGRLGAQKRMGKVLSNPRLADLMLRRIKRAEVGDDGVIREMLQADGYIGAVLADFYLEGDTLNNALDQTFKLLGSNEDNTSNNFSSGTLNLRSIMD